MWCLGEAYKSSLMNYSLMIIWKSQKTPAPASAGLAHDSRVCVWIGFNSSEVKLVMQGLSTSLQQKLSWSAQKQDLHCNDMHVEASTEAQRASKATLNSIRFLLFFFSIFLKKTEHFRHMLPLEMVTGGLKRFLWSAAHGVLAASRETGKFWMSLTI